MKLTSTYILKISVLIALGVFVIDGFLFGNFYNKSAIELVKSFSIHFLYAAVLTAINAYFFKYLDSVYDWKLNGKYRLVIGAVGSIILTMLGLAILRFVVLVVFFNQPITVFFNDKHASSYYTFGLIITLLVSLLFHVFYFFKAISEKKITEQQIVAKTETAKYESLKSQIDPHFLFNSLNVLTSLIGENPKQAEKFTTKLSKVYRYVLEQKNKDLIDLEEELEFAKVYMELLNMRFENAISFNIKGYDEGTEFKIIPLSLQLLLENAIKHNVVSEKSPLRVLIEIKNGYLKISNNYNPKESIEKGTKVGLKNIIDRYNLLTLKKVTVENTKTEFAVILPLLTQKSKIMKTSNFENEKYLRAVERVEEIKGFYSSLLAYCIVIPFLMYINFTFVPQFHWFWFPALGWGIGLVFQGFKAFAYNPFLGKGWEERKIQEFMNEDKNQYWE